MTVIVLFLIAGVAYSINASLPFLVSRNVQSIVAVLLGVCTSLSWTYISRAVPMNEIPYYGLAYDAMLTLLFLLVPYFFITFDLTNKQIFGIILVLIGLYLTKR